MSDFRYLEATCKIALFKLHWLTSKQVKPSQNVELVVKVISEERSLKIKEENNVLKYSIMHMHKQQALSDPH